MDTMKKNKILSFATLMDIDGIMLSKTEKDKHHMILLVCGL